MVKEFSDFEAIGSNDPLVKEAWELLRDCYNNGNLTEDNLEKLREFYNQATDRESQIYITGFIETFRAAQD